MARKVNRGRKSERGHAQEIRKPNHSRGRKKERDEGMSESIRDLFD